MEIHWASFAWQAWWFCGLHPCHERWMWPAKRWGYCEDRWEMFSMEVMIFEMIGSQHISKAHQSHKSRDVASRMGSDWLFGMAASAQPSQKRWRWMASKQGRRDLYKGIGRERERARLTCKMQWSYWGFWAGRWLGLWQSTEFVCVAWSMLHPGSLGHPRIDIATAILGTCPNNYTLLGSISVNPDHIHLQWISVYLSISLFGGVLKWWYPPNHPKLDNFSVETHGFGDPPFQKKTFIYLLI